MNLIQSFNRTIDYIDAALDGEIEPKKIAELSGYSAAMFSRIFSILTGVPLQEYIRRRKMTMAALDLLSTDQKIIDIAVKYGYDAADAFTVAFKAIHGCAPSEIRKGKNGKVYSKLKLSLTVNGGNEMNVKIQRKPGFKIAGIGAKGIESSECPKIWDRLFEKATEETLEALGSGQSYGACYEIQDPSSLNYLAGYDVRDEGRAKALGLEILSVPETEYAVVELTGKIPDCIHAGWAFIMKSSSRNMAIVIRARLISRYTETATCIPAITKWNSGYRSRRGKKYPGRDSNSQPKR